jgi:type I restriction-modification system DNA methylase subunit
MTWREAIKLVAGEGAIVRELLHVGTPWCVELSEKRCVVLQNLMLHALPIPIVLCKNFLEVSPHDAFGPPGGFDAVCMNPPFSKRQDIIHVKHALKFLKPGGKLVSVMSAGVTFRQDNLTKDFRAMIEDNDGDFTQLAPGSFKSSGTNVNAVVLEVVK